MSSENANSTAFRAGLVGLLGKPNVGKSSLMNLCVGHKVSIVSDKAQTTRRRVLGILTEPDYQIVFVDTPGVHKPHTHLGKILNEVAQQSIVGVDANIVVVDGSRLPDNEDRAIAQMLVDTGWISGTPRKANDSVVLCMNKMDLLHASNVEEHVEAYTSLFCTEQYMLTSMRKAQNVELLLRMVVPHLPEGDLIYPEDEFTDQPMRVMASEIVREKALQLTHQEVPHAIATVVDGWEVDEDTLLTRIAVTIVVEKDGQKAIMIGKKGEMLKRIGTESRLEIQELIGSQVFLELFVKVRADWRQNPRMLQELEYLN